VANEAFSQLWKTFLAEESPVEAIAKHRTERSPLLDRLAGAVAWFLEAHGGVEPVRVLEVGCGTAIDSYLLAAQFATSKVEFVATDIAPEALAVAGALASHFPVPIRLECHDAFQLGFPDRHFDLVFSQGVLEHFADPLPALREQRRVLRPSGLLLVDVPQKYNLYTLYKRPRVRRGTWRYGWETEYSPRELRRLGQALGLELVDMFGYGSGLELSDRFPWLRAAVQHYNRLTHWVAHRLPVSHWLLLNVVAVYKIR